MSLIVIVIDSVMDFDFLKFFCRTENDMKKVSKQINVQSLDDRKEELAESAKNKLKQGHLQKLQMFANERQYILSLLKKYFGKKILFIFLIFITEYS